MRVLGLEPKTYALKGRCSKDASTAKAKTYKISKNRSARSSAKILQKDLKNSSIPEQNLPDELADIAAVWPELPEYIKAAIKAMVDTFRINSK